MICCCFFNIETSRRSTIRFVQWKWMWTEEKENRNMWLKHFKMSFSKLLSTRALKSRISAFTFRHSDHPTSPYLQTHTIWYATCDMQCIMCSNILHMLRCWEVGMLGSWEAGNRKHTLQIKLHLNELHQHVHFYLSQTGNMCV